METNDWYKSVSYYGYKGRVIQSFSQNHLAGIDRTDFQYRFNNEVLKTRVVHNNSLQSITEIYEYTYDHVGRKTSFFHTKDGVSQKVAKYNYDAIGRMTQKVFKPAGSAVGSKQSGQWTDTNTWLTNSLPTINDLVTINNNHSITIPSNATAAAGSLIMGTNANLILQSIGQLNMGSASTSNLQSLDYKYHIRGGLLGINLDANNDLTNSLFSFRLDYETGSDGFFDGNIRRQYWKSSLDGKQRAYEYSYDGASRIKSANYASQVVGENYALNSVNYDRNGNITTLSRNGLKSNNTFGLIDNLAYTYNANSNKILKVDDQSNEVSSFSDIAGNDYTYWEDGALKSDNNKGISLIDYNYLKLPKRIVKGSTTILYQYDASGRKLRETIGTNVTDYVGNLIYKNNSLYQLSHDEGRIVNGIYEYNIKDHLGNLRVTFKDSLGVAKITQSNAYGVWGEDLPTLSYQNTANLNNFKFTEKEVLVETGYTDFGARFYDNIVPRFISQDPLSEFSRRFSPYTYTNDNPLRFIDSDGMASQTVYDFSGKSHTVGDDDMTTIYQAPTDYSNNETGEKPSRVAQMLFNNALDDSQNKTLDCSKDYACYPATWKRLEKAYLDADGSAPDVFKTSWSKPYKNNPRIYPKLNSIFAVLFGSDIQNKLWNEAPFEHRGKGAAGALVYAGLGTYADVWQGELQSAAVVQFWESQKTFESVRDGVPIPNQLGHSVIFTSYKRDSSGNIISFQYIDQRGVWTTPKLDKYVYFGANLIDQTK